MRFAFKNLLPHFLQRAQLPLLILVLASAALFIVRGPLRLLARSDYNDFVEPYVSARAWLAGGNPYDSTTVAEVWQSASGRPSSSRLAPMYPPTALPLLATIAWLNWPQALHVWVAINCAAAILLCVAVWQMGAGTLSKEARLIPLAVVLGFAPLHTGFATGQISFSVAALVVAAVWVRVHHPVLAGTILGSAAALKPQLVIFLLLFFVLAREHRIWISATFTGAIFAGVGLLRIQRLHPAWAQALESNAQYWFQPGSVHDYALGPNRFHLINLQMPSYAVLHSRTAANLFAWLMFSIALAIWGILVLRNTHQRLLALAGISAISLLPAYHRTYDAGLLVLAIVWALPQFLITRCRVAAASLICLLAFMFPTGAFLGGATMQGRIPGNVATSWWWQSVILPHQGWALLALVWLLIAALGTNSTNVADCASKSPPASPTRFSAPSDTRFTASGADSWSARTCQGNALVPR